MNSKAGFWRKCRFCFRCARFTVWVIVLLALAAFGWLNTVGLPGFLKTRLVTALHQRGVDLEFTRMRLRLVHGLICDNVRIGQAQDYGGPVLTAREVQVRVDFMALLHRKLQVDGLVMHHGRFDYPFSTNDSLTLTNLETDVRFEADDKWSLDHFHADFAGVTFNLGAEIEHAPEFRKWKMFSAAKNADRGNMQSSLRNFSDTLKQIHFEGQPQVNARLAGDARDVFSFAFAINVRAPGVQTPWFNARNLEFAARLQTPTNTPPLIDPAWGYWTNLQPFRIDWTARGADLKMGAFQADAIDSTGAWSAPELAVNKLSATLGGGPLEANVKLDVDTRNVSFNVNSGFDLHAISTLLAQKMRAGLAKISWTHPPLIHAGGVLVMPPWTNAAPDWQADMEPSLRLHGDLAFTNALVAGVAPVDTVHTHFRYANRVWSLPDLVITRGRTELELSGQEDEATKNFRCVVGGKVDGDSVKPFFTETNAAHGFSHLFFREPVALVLDVSGNLRDAATLSATGRVVATDFAIRGQWVDSLITTLDYTNLTAQFFHPQLTRANGKERCAAEKVTLDFAGQRLFLQGGEGHISSSAIGESIGPKTAKAMAPYEFLALPNVTAEGCIPLKQVHGEVVTDDADLRVDIIGTVPFRWRRFQTPQITGTIHWLANHLIITNVVSECYGGSAHGWGNFDVQTPGDGTDFSFFIDGTNVDFNSMGRALWSPTNQLRGFLSGKVNVTRANSSDWRTWDGYGQMQLRNGVLWDAPIFGMVSMVLNTLTPGLDIGNSKATDGGGHFTMTNGVIYTDSLEIRSLTMRVQYVGTVDLDENVAARAKAQLLRNTPLVGSIVSTVLWPVSKALECGITGTLGQPKITPVYIPFSGILAAPLHPIRAVEEMFSSPSTNRPAKP